MGKELNITKMEIKNIKVILLIISMMEKENIIMKMVNIIKDKLKMDLNTVKVNFLTLMIIYYMKEILFIIDMQEMENIIWKMGNIISENSKMD